MLGLKLWPESFLLKSPNSRSFTRRDLLLLQWTSISFFRSSRRYNSILIKLILIIELGYLAHCAPLKWWSDPTAIIRHRTSRFELAKAIQCLIHHIVILKMTMLCLAFIVLSKFRFLPNKNVIDESLGTYYNLIVLLGLILLFPYPRHQYSLLLTLLTSLCLLLPLVLFQLFFDLFHPFLPFGLFLPIKSLPLRFPLQLTLQSLVLLLHLVLFVASYLFDQVETLLCLRPLGRIGAWFQREGVCDFLIVSISLSYSCYKRLLFRFMTWST